jgi:hypothetical protein
MAQAALAGVWAAANSAECGIKLAGGADNDIFDFNSVKEAALSIGRSRLPRKSSVHGVSCRISSGIAVSGMAQVLEKIRAAIAARNSRPVPPSVQRASVVSLTGAPTSRTWSLKARFAARCQSSAPSSTPTISRASSRARAMSRRRGLSAWSLRP